MYTASVYMNYVYDPKVQGLMEASDTKRTSRACTSVPRWRRGRGGEEVDPSVANNPLIFPTKAMLDRVHIFDSKALNNQKYLAQWQNLISA